ncbi:hypothetical protein DdX_15677 [Ditylenchus destructor]|uniref:Uncharacterized protein n=1 Tax=Ditylenchus destructor TaxID=166010 RepID=A0AAD4QUJ6_9BILA|nr:hypothetical protein DdX_15677 [Ditylenchus destructor]
MTSPSMNIWQTILSEADTNTRCASLKMKTEELAEQDVLKACGLNDFGDKSPQDPNQMEIEHEEVCEEEQQFLMRLFEIQEETADKFESIQEEWADGSSLAALKPNDFDERRNSISCFFNRLAGDNASTNAPKPRLSLGGRFYNAPPMPSARSKEASANDKRSPNTLKILGKTLTIDFEENNSDS